jgi:hypothetical protein
LGTDGWVNQPLSKTLALATLAGAKLKINDTVIAVVLASTASYRISLILRF